SPSCRPGLSTGTSTPICGRTPAMADTPASTTSSTPQDSDNIVVRRSELTCPGHSLKMMAKAAATDADQVMFDLEDACAVSQKVEARQTVVEAFNTLEFGGKLRAFRPNNIRTKFFYRDLIEVVEA